MYLAKKISIIVFLFVILPIIYLLFSFTDIQIENWTHLIHYLLPDMLKSSTILLLGVIIGTSLIALPLAYIQTFYHFPGRKFFEILFLLPLAFPLYVYAAIGLTLFGLTGEVTLWIAKHTGISPFALNIKNNLGLIQVFSFALYPYLYVTMRESFETHGAKTLEVATILGIKKSKAIKNILLPLTRPWYAAGLTLIMMETLADFGASSMFNVNTFTTGIYRSWFGLFSLPTAAQIASLLISLIFICYFFYKRSEGKINFSMSAKSSAIKRAGIKGTKLILLYLGYSVFIFAVIGLPFYFLFQKTLSVLKNNFWTYFASSLQEPLYNSLILSFSAAFLIIILSYVMAYAKRFELNTSFDHLWFETSKLGYAIPGTIMAVALYVPLSKIEQALFGRNLITLTLIPLFLGYIIRFLSIGLNPLEVSFQKLANSHMASVTVFGINKWLQWKKIFFPLTMASAFNAFFMIFLEVLKELPITLMTRPFGKDTLAVKIFEYTSEGDWDRAAIPSFVLVGLGFFAVFFIYTRVNKKLK